MVFSNKQKDEVLKPDIVMHASCPSPWQAEVLFTGNQNDHSDGHNSVSLPKVTELSLDRLAGYYAKCLA